MATFGFPHQVLDLAFNRFGIAPQKNHHAPHGHTRDGHLENFAIEVRAMLPFDGLGLGGAEIRTTRLALIAWDGLVIVLGATVAFLAIEARHRRQVIDA